MIFGEIHKCLRCNILVETDVDHICSDILNSKKPHSLSDQEKQLVSDIYGLCKEVDGLRMELVEARRALGDVLDVTDELRRYADAAWGYKYGKEWDAAIDKARETLRGKGKT